MNKYFIFILLMFSGCVSSIKEKIKVNKKFENISFEKFDINKDGNITKEEFSSTEYAVNITEPIIWFFSIIAFMSILLYFSNKKRCN
jgi:hypothetical protein